MKKMLLQNEWSGNVRSWKNVIQRFVVLGNEENIIEGTGSKYQPHLFQLASPKWSLKSGLPSKISSARLSSKPNPR